MRSAREIRFRLAQQIANLRLVAFPPALPRNAEAASLPLPDAGATADFLRGTPYAAALQEIGKSILAHRFPIFGLTIETGPQIEWRKDYLHSRITGTGYFRFIPYLDFNIAGDHKIVWELNRHQHLVLLAQCSLLFDDPAYVEEIESQLTSWFQQNPFLRGINYASALEVAFRALSWLWVDHLAGPRLKPDVRRMLWNGLFQHGHFLEANLSTYFSPNTHLLGEGVALHALGLEFPQTQWASLGGRIVAEELDRQVQADGSHFEQSTYYHLYALDFFLFYFLLAGKPAQWEPPLIRMARFLSAVNGPSGQLNSFGDDDGGRLFHPFGNRSEFGRATLATCALLFPGEHLPLEAAELPIQAAWWLGPVNSASVSPSTNCTQMFADSGLISVARGNLHLLIDTGPFGPGGAGHSHSDSLSFTARLGNRELLIDPGTYTYVSDPQARNDFRGSGFHNTIRLDTRDQADPTRPFRWDNKPDVTCGAWNESAESVFIDASCRYRGFTHRRRFFLIGGSMLLVLDHLSGPGELHDIEQFWHLGPDAESAMTLLSTSAPPERAEGWRSRCLGTREQAPVLVFRTQSRLPLFLGTAILFETPREPLVLGLVRETNSITLRIANLIGVNFPESGMPAVLPQ
ncbi:MAG: heparinase II/III family protein [Acidobacteriota bacterium]|nr:heparinase II/III family protein [Acidobacteriota bacterium]